jgi:hypothetical protein
MKNTFVRSLAIAAIVAGIGLTVPSVAQAATLDPPVDATSHAAASSTGTSGAPVLGYWIGGGALALAGGAIAVGATVRRHRHDPQI